MKYTVSTFLSLSFIMLLFQANFSVSAHAATYNYMGEAYNTFYGPDVGLGDRLTASFTFSSAVTEGYTGSIDETNISNYSSWSVTSGGLTISSTTPNNTSIDFLFVFDNGSITEWFFRMKNYDPINQIYLELTSLPTNPTVFGDHAIYNDYINDPTTYAVYYPQPKDPGQWTYNTAPVPEPSTIVLFATGLIGLAGIARRPRTNR